MYEVDKEAVCNALYDTKIKQNGKLEKAIDFGTYILTSGKVSCMYANHRILSANPKNSNVILGEQENIVKYDTDADHVISSADAGIFWGSIVANRLRLPFSVMRKEKDISGVNKHMGVIPDYVINVVPVDDLNTTLGTVNKVIDTVHSLNHSVPHYVLSVDREEYTPDNLRSFENSGTEMHSLVTMKEIIDYGFDNGEIDKEKLNLVENYRENPENFAINTIIENPEWVRNHKRQKKLYNYYKRNDEIKEALEEIIIS